MSQLVFEQMAREHVNDLRREAAAHANARALSRADRARPRFGQRAALVLHRRPAVAGCGA